MTAAFKGLCIDAVDAGKMQQFWATNLGLRPERRGEDSLVLTGPRPEQTIWVNAVPESHAVKNRIHLDVNTGAVSELVERGAVVLDQSHPWTILADPEGNEFCGFVRELDQLRPYRLYELVVDGTNPRAIASWWAERFEINVDHDGAHPWWIDGGNLPFGIVFNRVPEPKTVKNRVHWDVIGKTQEFLDAGAKLVREADDEISWDILADPEGNEFCVFRP